MTHNKLVQAGRVWALTAKSCNPVFTERGSQCLEEFPDIIGWKSTECIVVECKASISDFMADFKKPHRNTEQSLGQYRYYLIPFYLFKEVENIDRHGWGLLTCDEHYNVRQVSSMGSIDFASNKQSEVIYLRSRILQIQSFGR